MTEVLSSNTAEMENSMSEYNLKEAEVCFNRGLNRKKAFENRLSIADFTEAIELNPDYVEAYLYRGKAYLEKGELDRAIADFTKMLVLKPKVAENYYIRGEAYLHAKKWEEAKRDLTAAILQEVDISQAFFKAHDSITAFEDKIGTQLPEDLRLLLVSKPESFVLEKDARVALAMKYYEDRELSSGLASKLADIPRAEFILRMGNYGLSPLGTVEEIIESGL